LYRTCGEYVRGKEYIAFPALICRLARDLIGAADVTGKWADYLRGLFDGAGSRAETSRTGTYRRKQEDQAYSTTVSPRRLFMVVALLTGSFVRDYITRRFLTARGNMMIKSPVRREIMLDSTIR
jgi:hypothetical protein